MNAYRLILLLDDQNLSLHRADGTSAETLARWPLDDAALPALQRQIQSHRRACFHLLTDLSGEDFRLEHFPLLSAADQQRLRIRKQQQIWPATPYYLIRPTTGQTTTHLLGAQSSHGWIDRIVELLQQNACMLGGIHSVAMATAELLQDSPIRAEQWLLLSHQHQFYFTPDGLRFVRPCPLPDMRTDHAEILSQEIQRLCQYLISQRLLESGARLTIVLLGEAMDYPGLVAGGWPIAAAAHHLPIANLAARLGLPASADLPTLLLGAIARGRVSNHYAPADLLRPSRMRQLACAIKLAAVCIVLAGTVAAWLHGKHMWQQRHAIAAGLHLLEQLLVQQRDARQKVLAVQLPDEAREKVSLYRRYLEGWPDVEQTAQAISRQLAGLSALQLEHFRWQVNSSTGQSTDSSSDGGHWQQVELAGSIDIHEPRAAVGALQELASRLARLPRVQILEQQFPFDPQGLRVLSSAELQAPRGPFLLRLIIAPLEETGR